MVRPPILVGPVHRIGGMPKEETLKERALVFEGQKKDTASAAGGPSYVREGNTLYQVTSVASQRVLEGGLDETVREAVKVASGKPGGMVVIEKVCADTWFHHYVAYASGGVKLSMDGFVLLPKGDSQ